MVTSLSRLLSHTVQAVLAARVDRLPEREKELLQAASVIGKIFPEEILSRVSELPPSELADSVSLLMRSEFLYRRALYPRSEYEFKHPLTQEVAYESQLRERRMKVHAAVARTIAELSPDMLDEQAAMIAHHWEAAGENLEAARWHCRAAEWTGMRETREGLSHWRRVRTLLVFALFGAPLAHEDHAMRALHAARRMQEDIKRYSDWLRIEKGVPLAIRVGLTPSPLGPSAGKEHAARVDNFADEPQVLC